ncbi:MAG: tetratricopeptide repeat protein [Candidatus Hodarchaeota archaeon]
MAKQRGTLDELMKGTKIDFVNREDLFVLTQDWINSEKEKFILYFYGLGGIGKSFYKDELINRYSQNVDIFFVSIDLKTPHYRRIPEFLFQIRLQLGKQLKISFKNFDLAYTIYFKTAMPTLSLKEPASILEEGSLLFELFSVLQDAPMIATLPKMWIFFKKRITWFRTWLQGRQSAFQILLDLAERKNIHELERNLMYFLVEDLNDFIKENIDKKIILCVDSLEYLIPESIKSFFSKLQNDEWFREIVWNIASVKWIIFGRNKLVWNDLNKKWINVLNQHQIRDLELSFRKIILENHGIEERWQVEISKRSFGVPIYLQLSIEMYQRAKLNKMEITLDDFQPNIDELLSCFLKFLDREEESALFLIAIPRFWNENIWFALINKYQPALKTLRHSEFCLFSFIDSDEKGNRYLHPLIRELLLKKEEDHVYEERNLFLANYYRKQALIKKIHDVTSIKLISLQEALYHFLQQRIMKNISEWFWTLVNPYKEAGFYNLLLPYIQLLVDKLCDNDYNHNDVSIALNNFGYLLQEMGNYEEAERVYFKDLSLLKQYYGENHHKIGVSLDNLGCLYIQSARYEEAESKLKKALEINENYYGPDHPQTGITLNNYANLLIKTGQYQKAEEYAQLSLFITEKEYGLYDKEVASKLSNLAGVLRQLGKYDKAEPLCRRALKITEQKLGKDSLSTGVALNNLAELLSITGNHQQKLEAVKLYKRALEITKDKLGEEHPTVGKRLNNLAELMRKLGRFDEAEVLIKKAISITRKALGEDHPDLAIRLNNYALLLSGIGQYDEAEILLRKALDITEAKFGNEHPVFVKRLNNLASLLREIGKISEAEINFRKAKERSYEILGEDHPLTGQVINNLGYLLLQKNNIEDYKEAATLFERSLEITENTFGSNHPKIIPRLDNLAKCLFKLSRYKEAVFLYRRSLIVTQNNFGKHHHETGRKMNNLAIALKRLGNLEESEKLCRDALSICIEHFGNNDQRTLGVLDNLINILTKREKFNEAEQLRSKYYSWEK